MSFKNELKSIPVITAGYFKDHRATIETAKKDKRWLVPILYTLIFLASGLAAIGGFLSGAQKAITHISFEGIDFSGVHFYSFRRAAVLGIMLTLILFFNYLIVRLICIKIFTRGSKAVLLESFIEFSLHSTPVTLLFLIGGLLGLLRGVFALAAVIIGTLYLFVVLINGIIASVEPEKVKPRLYLIVSLFAVIGYIGVSVVLAAAFLLITAGIIKSVAENIVDILIHFAESFIS